MDWIAGKFLNFSAEGAQSFNLFGLFTPDFSPQQGPKATHIVCPSSILSSKQLCEVDED